jgi:hypothetical protein
MTKTSDWAEQLSAPATPAAALSGPGLSGTALDAVVDAVVERIEQRVVDELERRGRRDGRSW